MMPWPMAFSFAVPARTTLRLCVSVLVTAVCALAVSSPARAGFWFGKKPDTPPVASIDLKGIKGPLLDNALAYIDALKAEGLPPDSSASRVRVEEAVRSALRALGYFEPEIQTRWGTGRFKGQLAIHVTPGEPVRLAKTNVKVSGPGSTDPLYQQTLKKVPPVGAVLDQGRYTAFKASLNDVALAHGYFDARFTHHELGVQLPFKKAFWDLQVQTGPRYRFGAVTFSGSPIREDFLRALMPFTPNDDYDADLYAEFQRNLNATGWFNAAVLTPDLKSGRRDHTVPIHAELVQRKRNSIDLGLGFATDVGPRATVDWGKPWINNRGMSVDLSTAVSKKEQSVDNTLKVPLKKNPLVHYYTLKNGFKHTALNDTRSDSIALDVARHWEYPHRWQRIVHLKYSFDRFTQADERHRTMLLYPGIAFSRTRSRGGLSPYWGDTQRYSIDAASHYIVSDVDFVVVNAHNAWVRTWRNNHRFVLRATGGWIHASDFDRVPPDLRFFAGGDKSIRGYDYRSIAPRDADGKLIGGKKLLTGSLEYQYRLRGQWWGALFADSGLAANHLAPRHFKSGLGAGIRWISPIGPIKLDIAFPTSEPVSARSAHLYIGLGSEL